MWVDEEHGMLVRFADTKPGKVATYFVEDELIERAVVSEDLDLEGKCEKLVELAKENGGADNITVILACNE